MTSNTTSQTMNAVRSPSFATSPKGEAIAHTPYRKLATERRYSDIDLLYSALELSEAAQTVQASMATNPDLRVSFSSAATPELILTLARFVIEHLTRPMVMDERGAVYFKDNAICHWLVVTGKADLNEIAMQGFSRRDRAEFAQLIGYAVNNWSGLSYVSQKQIELSDTLAEILSVSPSSG